MRWKTITMALCLTIAFKIIDAFSFFPGKDNKVLFEKVEVPVMDKELMPMFYFNMRPIAPNVFKMNLTVDLTQPLNKTWVGIVLYYKYNTYQKYLIDIWDEGCKYLNAGTHSPLADVLIFNALKFDFKFNFELRCPAVSGKYSVTHEHLNVSQATIPLLSSGRYRAEMWVAQSKGGRPFAVVKAYFSISDIRIWH